LSNQSDGVIDGIATPFVRAAFPVLTAPTAQTHRGAAPSARNANPSSQLSDR
jgi:hypothetical protein